MRWILETEKYIGKPYRHRRKGDRFDCLSLINSVLNENGYNLPEDDGKEISENWYQEDPERLIKGLTKYGNRIPADLKQPLDVVVFSFRGIPSHCGIMTDRSHFMHVRQGKTVSISRLKHYRRYLHSIWRMEV